MNSPETRSLICLKLAAGGVIAGLGILVSLTTSPASAAEAVGGDENGQVVLVQDYQSESGSPCVVSSGNNESIHTGNLLVIEQGGLVIDSGEIENNANDGFDFPFVSNGDPIRVYIQLADDITSADVTISCEPPPPVTTTSTVPEEVTTTTAPEEVTTTTAPEEVTTTTVPEEVTTTTTTTPPPDNCPPDGLACTGGEASLSLAFGLLFVVLGGITLVAKELLNP